MEIHLKCKVGGGVGELRLIHLQPFKMCDAYESVALDTVTVGSLGCIMPSNFSQELCRAFTLTAAEQSTKTQRTNLD